MAHRHAQLGVGGVGEAVHDVQTQGRFESGVLGGEVQDPTAADRGELVAVAHERHPCLTGLGDLEQGAGGVLIEHPGLVHDQQVTAAEHRLRLGGEVFGAGPVAVVVPPPPPLVGEPGRRERWCVDLPGCDLGGLQRRRHDHHPAALRRECCLRPSQGGGLPGAGRAFDDQ